MKDFVWRKDSPVSENLSAGIANLINALSSDKSSAGGIVAGRKNNLYSISELQYFMHDQLKYYLKP